MTMRQIHFTGIVAEPESAGIISMNGVEVFNGLFTGEIDIYTTIATANVDVDNSLAVDNYVSVPTSITVTSGAINIALSNINYAAEPNPIFTWTQWTTLNDLFTSPQSKLAIYNAVVATPLSTADQKLLLSSQPEEQAARQAVLVANNLTMYVQPVDDFNSSISDVINRMNVRLDGEEPPQANTPQGIAVVEGQVLTYETLFFVTDYYTHT